MMTVGSLLSHDEIARLTRRSDWRGAWAVVSTWGMIGGAFLVLARWPNPFTFLAALIVIAGRQMALGILQHEASHGTLFKMRWCNQVVGDWACARPVWQTLDKYRRHHLRHHAETGTDGDPDISLHRDYPVTRVSLRRKLTRDVAGVTGMRTVAGLLLMDAGLIRWTVANDVIHLPRDDWWRHGVQFAENIAPMLATNGVLFIMLSVSGHPGLFAVWVLAFITPLPLFLRIRSVAEHGCLPRTRDVFANTRTIRAGWLARLTVAPVAVNYHLEHHLLPGVPYYRLRDLHALLRAKGLVAEPDGYWAVLKRATV